LKIENEKQKADSIIQLIITHNW